MNLRAGTRLGAYEILSGLGAGGMGQVYRARDVRLGRDVAIKVMSADVARDSERLGRFRREAHLLASLNHPNIGAIYGFEEIDSQPLLILELVEGRTLADILEGSVRAIPIEEALHIARQIADALEAAHEKGIIHRDLKPGNIMVSPEGTVKVLDFGLAKSVEPTSNPDLSMSPTATLGSTQAGVLMGTAPYMSPEQFKGRAADKRSDVWAFGCVLYEMLTGKRTFQGEDVTDLVTAIMRDSPRWEALPPDTPDHIKLLLKRCLDRDRKTRISDLSTARFLLDEQPLSAAKSTVAAVPVPAARRPQIVTSMVALIAGLTIGGIAIYFLRPAPAAPARHPVRFALSPPQGEPLALALTTSDDDLAISPDGTRVVYRAGGPSGGARFYLRGINDLSGRPLPGTDAARGPFFSPDSQSIGFFTSTGQLARMSLAAGSPVVICEYPGVPRGASWSDDGTIIFATNVPRFGLQAVAAAGGTPRQLAEDLPETIDFFPIVLPGSKTVLFTRMSVRPAVQPEIHKLDMATGRTESILQGAFHAQYVDPGYLVYASELNGPLRAIRFDLSSLRVSGDPAVLPQRVLSQTTGTAKFALSRNGSLVYAPAESQGVLTRSLVWVDRGGREEPIKAPARTYAMARISPDGTRIALDIRDQSSDIWIWNFARQTLSRLTTDQANDLAPLWSQDGSRVIFASSRTGNPNLFWQAADGTGSPERLSSGTLPEFPTSLTADGQMVAFFNLAGAPDIFMLPLTGAHDVKPLIQTRASESNASFSPDGKWIAYQSTDSGSSEIYVRPFPNVDASRSQISPEGGTRPAWHPNGKELFYLDAKGQLMSAAVTVNGTEFSAGAAQAILTGNYYAGASITGADLRAYDVARDGRFLMIKDDPSAGAPGGAAPSAVVVLNWIEELKQQLR